jgi:hypothetical protein
MVVARMPKAAQSPRRSNEYYRPESWWHEPQDLSRFAGMTEAEIATKLLGEFRDLRKSWVFD